MVSEAAGFPEAEGGGGEESDEGESGGEEGRGGFFGHLRRLEGFGSIAEIGIGREKKTKKTKKKKKKLFLVYVLMFMHRRNTSERYGSVSVSASKISPEFGLGCKWVGLEFNPINF